MRTKTATKLSLITQRSKSNPKEKFNTLSHLLDEEYLNESYKELKRGKAAGIDKRTLESYSKKEIEEEIVKAVDKLERNRYRPKPTKRIYIEKANGKKRPLGLPTVRDKIVQQSIKKIIEAIYEPLFLDCSYGFRPKRNCHQALKRGYKMIMTKPVNWVIDIDIKGFFDNVEHNWIIKCIEERISHKRFISLIIKFLKAGVVYEGKYSGTVKGVPQGGILSPILANIYLHYVLDLWFEKVEKKNIKGYTELIRYADDFIIGAQTKVEAEQILKDIEERLAKFGLETSKEKTGIVEFGRYAKENSRNRGNSKPETFDFLGITHYCSKSSKGNYLVKQKTSKKKKKQHRKEANLWLKKNRNRMKIKDIWKILASKLRGHYNYYGISSNSREIQNYYYMMICLTKKWMNRRSHKKSFNWTTFSRYLKLYPLPKPVLVHSFYDCW